MSDTAVKNYLPRGSPSVPSAFPPATANHNGEVDRKTRNDVSAAESEEEEEDIVFQMRGLRGLGAGWESVAPRKESRYKEQITESIVTATVSAVCYAMTRILIQDAVTG